MTPHLIVEHQGGVATVTLHRPDKLNALDQHLLRDLTDALYQLAADPAIRAVVLTGSGRGFCAGQDLAAVNGLAVGAGMGLALACDLRIAADTAGFACAFGKVGLVPDTAVTWYLVRELGYARAFASSPPPAVASPQHRLSSTGCSTRW